VKYFIYSFGFVSESWAFVPIKKIYGFTSQSTVIRTVTFWSCRLSDAVFMR